MEEFKYESLNHLSVEEKIKFATDDITYYEERIEKAEKEIARYAKDLQAALKKGKMSDVRHNNSMITHQFSNMDDYQEKLEAAKEMLERAERDAKGWADLDQFLEELLQKDIKWHQELKASYQAADKEGRKKFGKGEVLFASLSAKEALKVFKQDLVGRRVKFEKQVTEKVGEFISLEIERNENDGFDGYVTGTKGKASLQTIGAGGYNIQRFHYRTLIKAVKEGAAN